jgi:hypothetical protein
MKVLSIVCNRYDKMAKPYLFAKEARDILSKMKQDRKRVAEDLIREMDIYLKELDPNESLFG